MTGVFEGDPLADRLMKTFAELPGGTGWQMLDEALLHGPERVAGAPPELSELLAPAIDPPGWLDLDLVDAGAVAFWRGGRLNLALALICGSLAYGYQSARLTRPLAATGRLETMALRRLQETGRWLLTATRPCALPPGAEGLRATVRLRMVHALVRSHLLASPKWDRAAWGVPISATDTILTAMGGFMAVPLRAMEDLGVRLSPAELEAIAHQWTWIASLMGAPKGLLPRSLGEIDTLLDTAHAIDEGPTEDSPKLMRALLHNGAPIPYEQRIPGFAKGPAQVIKTRLLGGLARRWMDDEIADSLGIPDSRLTGVMRLLRLLTLRRELHRMSNRHSSDEQLVRSELEGITLGPRDTAEMLEAHDAPPMRAPAPSAAG